MTSSKSEIARRVMAGQPLDHIPVIDMHGHLGSSSEYYYVPRSTNEEVIQYFDRYGVDHLVAFPFTLSTDVATGNRDVLARAEAHPDRFSALVALHAAFPVDWEAMLGEGLRRGARGIKLISGYQGVSEMSVDWTPALEFARDKSWMVLNHSWGTTERLIDYAHAFPEIVFIIGHAFNWLAEAARVCENVYQCTCAHFVNPHATVEIMCRELPAEKIVFGSDTLDLDLGTAIGPIALSDIPEDVKELILGGNAVRIAKQMGWAWPHCA